MNYLVSKGAVPVRTRSATRSRGRNGLRYKPQACTTLALKFDKRISSTKVPRDAAARDRWHGLAMTVRRAAAALEYPQMYPTTPPDLQKSSWLTMVRRQLHVSQESPESQGHHAHEESATRGCWSISKVPPATLSTGTPRQLALRSRIPSLLLVIDCVICRVS